MAHRAFPLRGCCLPHYLRKREFLVSLLAAGNKMHFFKRFACPEATNCIRPAALPAHPLEVTPPPAAVAAAAAAATAAASLPPAALPVSVRGKLETGRERG